VNERLGVQIGPPKDRVEAGDPLRLQAIAAPFVQGGSQSRPLLGVEFDRPTRADRLETHANRFRPLGEGELLEQDVALAPGDLDYLAGDVDVHAVEALGHRRESRT
jgi:hypothetical protein